MAGLCGVFALDEGPDCIELNRRLAVALRHRGPDGCHAWSGSGAAVAHLALNVRARQPCVLQPLRLEDGRICVVDGHVAHPTALLRALGHPEGVPAPHDAQCIAMAVERWGLEFWRRIDGDFAIAVWDPASRNLLLARDRLGVRPLFHVRTPELVAFCSEPEPLFGLPGVDGRVRAATVAEVWTQRPLARAAWSDNPGAVQSVPPAHWVLVDRGGKVRLERYWRLQPQPVLKLADEAEYVEAFRHVFKAAVSSTMREVEIPALMLSGGIDSGAVLAASRGFGEAETAGRLLCISAVTDDSVPDSALSKESANIRAMTAAESRVLHFTVPSMADTGEVVEAADAAEIAWTHRHPIDASVYIPSLVCRVARQNGSRVVMTGVDGDVVTASPHSYPAVLALGGNVAAAWREARAASGVHTYLKGQSALRLLTQGLLAELQPRWLRRWRIRRALSGHLRDLASSELSPALLQAAGLAGSAATGLGQRLAEVDVPLELRRCETMANALRNALWGFNRISSRQGVEARFPWADISVVEFFLSLPLEWRVRHGRTKYLVRKACERSLGAQVAWHSGKRHHGFLVTRQLLIDAAPYWRAHLAASRGELAQWLKVSFLDEVDRGLSNPTSMDVELLDRINKLLALEGWLARQGTAFRPHDSA